MKNLEVYFGQNVRDTRKKQQISQENLALIAGIDRSYMSRVERGIVSITLQKAYVIAQALQCDVKDLLPTMEQLSSSNKDP
ncbi:MAG: transcriptional regulator with XRE-family HTH domain [Psychromonas sp.]|jgi:transcriptional regulator with XRE-family HTH domain